MNQKNEQIQLSNFNHPAILIVGRMGSGKSTLGNMLIEGSNPFETSSRFDTVTKVCKEGTATIKGNQYTIVDTPGIFDNNSPPEKIISEIMSYVLRCAHGIKAIICVFEATRFSPEQEQALKLLRTAFADEVLNNYVIAVFSKPSKAQMNNPEEMRQDWNTTFTEYIKSIGDRWGIAPNSDIFEPDTEVHQSLLMEIKKLIINTPKVYTDEEFKIAREKFEMILRDKKIAENNAKERYEKELTEKGEKSARENYNNESERINQNFLRNFRTFLTTFSVLYGVVSFISIFYGFPGNIVSKTGSHYGIFSLLINYSMLIRPAPSSSSSSSVASSSSSSVASSSSSSVASSSSSSVASSSSSSVASSSASSTSLPAL